MKYLNTVVGGFADASLRSYPDLLWVSRIKGKCGILQIYSADWEQTKVYAPYDIEASIKHQRVVDCILEILL
jgi:hypothetical protein